MQIGQKNTKIVDMTKGSILKGMLIFLFPLLIGNLFQQAYNVVDSIIVGQILGDDAFTAVGATGSSSFMILGFASGLTSGLAVCAAQYFGAKDEAGLRKSLVTSILISLISAIVLTVVGIACIDPLLTLTDLDGQFYQYAKEYLFPIFIGIVFTIAYNLFSNILRSLGDTRTPLYALILGCLVNIGADYLFVGPFNMGIAGAAWATILSQAISAIYCAIWMFYRYSYTRIKKEDWKPVGKMYASHVRISLPMAVQFAIVGIGLLMQQKGANMINNAYMAEMAGNPNIVEGLYTTAYSAAGRIDGFSNCVILAIGTMMATYCGQNYGSADLPRIKKGLYLGTVMGISVCLVMAAILIPLTPYILYLFLQNPSPEVQQATFLYMAVQLGCYALLSTLYVFRSSIQGLGRSEITIIVSAVELVLRIIFALVLAQYAGWIGLSFSNPIAWVGADLVLIPAMILIIKKFNRQQKEGTFGLKKETKNTEETTQKESGTK